MDKNKNTWWDLPAWSKWDSFSDDGSDDYLVGPMLQDVLTEIEQHDKDYILYSEKGEAILYRPRKFLPKLGMELYLKMMQVIKHT